MKRVGRSGKKKDKPPSSEEEEDDSSEESSSSEEEEVDWEEVPSLPEEISVEDHNLEISKRIPEEGLVITVSQPGPSKQANKYDPKEQFRLQLNRDIREQQANLHKVNILCSLSRIIQLNELLRDEELRGRGLSLLVSTPLNNPPSILDRGFLEKAIIFVRMLFLNRKEIGDVQFDDNESLDHLKEVLTRHLSDQGRRTNINRLHRALLGVILLRELGFDTRLVYCIQTLPLRPSSDELLKKPAKPEDNDSPSKDNNDTSQKDKEDEDDDSDYDDKPKGKRKTTKSKNKRTVKNKKDKGRKNSNKKQKDATIDGNGSHDQNNKSNLFGMDTWLEVYVPKERRWSSLDIESGKLNRDVELEAEAPKPMLYVFGIDNEGKVKDVTRRYANKWLAKVSKKRVDSDWLDETLQPYRTYATTREEAEDNLLDEHVVKKSFPENLNELSGHPLYTIERLLKQAEVIYPPNAQPAGTIKCVPYYSRNLVKTLYTRQAWLRQGMVAKLGELPYKKIKARPKMTKTGSYSWASIPTDKEVELFGEWQVVAYVPPPAKDGIVPRNEYGNVELFKPEMLPKGTVHLVLPGLGTVAKKLNIDCAPALTNFEFTGIGCRPVFNGFVVCDEFKEILLDAWNQTQDEQERKTEEKRKIRVRANWRRLIRGVLIKLRLTKKYMLGSCTTSNICSLPKPSSSRKNVEKPSTAKRKQESSKLRAPPAKKGRKSK